MISRLLAAGRSRALLAVLVLALAAGACIPLAGPERDGFVLLNQVRADAGVGPVVPDQGLQDRARDFAVTLGQEARLRHSGLRAESVPGARIVAENVAVGGSLEAAVEALVESAPHERNMTDGRFTKAGMAAVTGRDGRTYVVQVFAG